MVSRQWGKKFRAQQIFQWLYEKSVTTFQEMTNIIERITGKTGEVFQITTLQTVIKQTSADGTIKFLFELQDGYSIETVLMA